jgi:hypothetical protein
MAFDGTVRDFDSIDDMRIVGCTGENTIQVRYTTRKLNYTLG